MDQNDEAALVGKVLDGDVGGYRYFIERYHKGLIQHIYNIVGDEATAEDVAQEAFIRAYDNLSKYNPEYAFSTWLYKIASNIALRFLKQNSRFVPLNEDSVLNADKAPPPDEKLDAQLTKETVVTAIDKLPTKYRFVITMYYWDDLSLKEISEALGSPEGTIKTWLFRAKKILRKELYGQV
ncbi:MAG TPA: sigma-70 family RNA polymerase sigma factor [Candidatus Sulfotelmatobacter sp.]|nr:sigma-70 family RNA polymerase sigma factor [Candidatus Sulfotelmatobacter sp.]